LESQSFAAGNVENLWALVNGSSVWNLKYESDQRLLCVMEWRIAQRLSLWKKRLNTTGMLIESQARDDGSIYAVKPLVHPSGM
jgi:hypothetical protein